MHRCNATSVGQSNDEDKADDLATSLITSGLASLVKRRGPVLGIRLLAATALAITFFATAGGFFASAGAAVAVGGLQIGFHSDLLFLRALCASHGLTYLPQKHYRPCRDTLA